MLDVGLGGELRERRRVARIHGGDVTIEELGVLRVTCACFRGTCITGECAQGTSDTEVEQCASVHDVPRAGTVRMRRNGRQRGAGFKDGCRVADEKGGWPLAALRRLTVARAGRVVLCA
jgi:hypothetical protein